MQPRRGRPQRGRGRPTARSSAGCTGRCSTCAPASPPTSPRPSRSPPSPIDVRGTRRVRRHRDHPERSHPRMSKLVITDLHVTVDTEDGPKEILKGVTLTIKEGETHAIMGPNGSGKSTLAYSIAGHPKYTITGGSVTLDGQDVLSLVGRRARPRRPVPRHAVPRRGPRRLGVELPPHRQDRHRRRGPQAAHVGQGRQRAPSSSSTSTRPSAPAASTRASPAARRSATRSPSSSCSTPRSRCSTRPTPASTSTR